MESAGSSWDLRDGTVTHPFSEWTSADHMRFGGSLLQAWQLFCLALPSLFIFLKRGTSSVAQTSLELMVVLLPQPCLPKLGLEACATPPLTSITSYLIFKNERG